MGNRANVVFANKSWNELSPAIYLHWNGGPESVYAFVAELDRRNVRADQCYEAARFAQIVGEFFDGKERLSSTSLGLANVPAGKSLLERIQKVKTDPSDNGFFVIDRAGKKVRRFVIDWERTKATDYKETLIKELSAEEVEKEKAEAMKDEYFPGIAEQFKEMTAGRKVE